MRNVELADFFLLKNRTGVWTGLRCVCVSYVRAFCILYIFYLSCIYLTS